MRRKASNCDFILLMCVSVIQVLYVYSNLLGPDSELYADGQCYGYMCAGLGRANAFIVPVRILSACSCLMRGIASVQTHLRTRGALQVAAAPSIPVLVRLAQWSYIAWRILQRFLPVRLRAGLPGLRFVLPVGAGRFCLSESTMSSHEQIGRCCSCLRAEDQRCALRDRGGQSPQPHVSGALRMEEQREVQASTIL